ncbi:MAG: protein-L-isoaspartate(D-aspartate) O-methyltransferase [Candidatus Omnitrophica bacterium]|nr:protein-L-isoaspartate(D-aspartate) O-methyltransferase [Candidatus Omnitrophota bacterium]
MRKRRFLVGFLLGIMIVSCIVVFAQDKYFIPRKRMVEDKIAGYGIINTKIIKAFLRVPRQEFVLPEYKEQAYEDKHIPIGEDNNLCRPYIAALMTKLLDLHGDEKVMELGTGSGYHSAILSLLCKEVYTVDISETMKQAAEERLKKLGYDNVFCRLGEGTLGWPEEAPFDAIIVGFAADSIIPELVSQLKEGGKLIIPVGGETQQLKLVTKKDGEVVVKDVISVQFVPMMKSLETNAEAEEGYGQRN